MVLLAHGLHWLLALLLLMLAAYSKDPSLLAIRPYETPGILIFGTFLAVLATRKGAGQRRLGRSGRASLALMLVCLSAAVVVLAREIRFRHYRQAVLSAPPADLRRLGAHLVVGIRDVREAALLAERGAVGGFFVTRRNVKGKSQGEIREAIRRLQDLRRDKGLCPLIFAVDQEGGRISRLSPPLTALPPMSAWIAGADTPEALAGKARAYGDIHGRELAELGIDVNFSPVADLRIERDADPLDFNSFIPQRAISGDPDRVAVAALHYAEALARHGVHATLKHFPGLGRVSGDTHHFSVVLDASVDTLSGSDWVPFRRVLTELPALLMLSHVRLAAVDPEIPVSYSKPVIDGLIRRNWRFDGVLITDDLTMGAVYRSPEGIDEAAVRSLAAGSDLLLVSYDSEKAYEVLYALLQADRAGRLDHAALDRSIERLRRTFTQLGSCPLP